MGANVNMIDRCLPRTFYTREPEAVGRDLIGTHLVRRLEGQLLIGRIVEAEAYHGPTDTASHARSGITARNFPMFGQPGHSYVYFIYGMHWMFNIVAHLEGTAGAILIRALQPVAGLERMQALRGGRPVRDLTNGPARLAQALAIDASLNDVDLCACDVLALTAGGLRPGERVVSGPRVRVPGDLEARNRPWRFWIADNPCVS